MPSTVAQCKAKFSSKEEIVTKNEEIPLNERRKSKDIDSLPGAMPQEDLNAEILAYSRHLNRILASFTKDLDCYLPLTESTFFDKMQDGLVLAFLIYNFKPDSIDISKLSRNLQMSSLHTPHSKTIFEVSNNHNLVLQAARQLGIKTINIGSEDILGKKPALVLGLIWQLIRCHMLAKVNLTSYPELIRLMQKGETLETLLSLSPEQILVRWFNYHLAKSACGKSIANFSTDLADSSAYVNLLQQICPSKMKIDFETIKSSLKEDNQENAKILLQTLDKMGCSTFVTPADIASGHPRLNLCLVSSLFNNFIGITLPSEEEIRTLYEKIDNLTDEVSGLNDKIVSLKNEFSISLKENNSKNEILLQERDKIIVITTEDLKASKVKHETEIACLKENFSKDLTTCVLKKDEERKELETSLNAKISGLQSDNKLFKEKLLDIFSETCQTELKGQGQELLSEIKQCLEKIIAENLRLKNEVVVLSTSMEQKDKLNDVMSLKIKEYSEDLIKSKKIKDKKKK